MDSRQPLETEDGEQWVIDKGYTTFVRKILPTLSSPCSFGSSILDQLIAGWTSFLNCYQPKEISLHSSDFLCHQLWHLKLAHIVYWQAVEHTLNECKSSCLL